MNSTVNQALRRTGIDRLDAEVLLAEVLKKDRAWLLTHGERALSAADVATFAELVSRRTAGQPIAYLIGRKEFYGREFLVNPNVLIPRPETEELVELVLANLPIDPIVVDIGTGSGCIAVTLALESPARVLAVDVSSAALSVARQNAKRLVAKVEFHQADLWPAWLELPAARTVVVANLPYIPDLDYERLPDLAAEPALALRGGPDGTDLFRRLLKQFETAAWWPAQLWLEIDPSQTAALLAVLPGQVSVQHDLSGRERFLLVQSFSAKI